ncbi:uncharacterized protein F5891DRAFT_984032 [Suillus fuscotomentosus]|uniref:Uncharacterized protein n=1 Tax=Suillus fuscotomentosus TaxID=1912939 RepID=A0AAD4DZI4_9AGAM|nr:uncharacterized protein F5891DRAFT_984032 [Suillus fuscotomentosus]KAG1895729.1 hypothetical protein F5891DRAFT_984032 [Suillus fuscotomentosus]
MSKYPTSTEPEQNAKHVRFEGSYCLRDSKMEKEFHAYLSDRHCLLNWMQARLVLCSGDGNDKTSLVNLLAVKCKHILAMPTGSMNSQSSLASGSCTCQHYSRMCKNPYIDIEAEQDNNNNNNNEEDDQEEENIKIKNGPLRCANVMLLPGPKHKLFNVIDRIEQNVHSGSSSIVDRLLPVAPCFIAALLPKRMYVFTIHLTMRKFLAKHLQKQEFPVVVSLWIPAHLYMTSNNPLTIMAAVHDSLKVSMKKWD